VIFSALIDLVKVPGGSSVVLRQSLSFVVLGSELDLLCFVRNVELVKFSREVLSLELDEQLSVRAHLLYNISLGKHMLKDL
jgi:hypothetical protein